MPGGDRTGPAGYGPRTGRGLGYCAGYSRPGYTRGGGWGRGGGFGRGFGRGYGRGFGRGWGYRDPYYGPYAPAPAYAPAQPISASDNLSMLKQEKEYLESEMKGMQSAIEDISRRITELESKE
jgi:hypothetical protein